jgi:alginate O-acetyltransferase complex protein AlgI
MALKFRNLRKAGIVLSLFLTFVICGLWHGANWTFIVWGSLFGVVMGIEAVTSKLRKKLQKKINPFVYKAISWFLTFHFIVFLWIFFRAQDINTALLMFKQIFTNMDWTYLLPFISVRILLINFILIGIAFYIIPAKWFPQITKRFEVIPFWAKVLIFIAIVQVIIQFQSADVQPFLYAGF